MRNICLAGLSVILCLFISVVSCSKQDPENPDPTPSTIAVQSVSLNKTSSQIKVGESLVLVATVSPSNATDKSVTWSTSNASVATVANGTVKAVGAGSADITVRTNSGGKTATCKVTVSEEVTTISVTGVSLDKASAQLVEGDQLTLTATVSPTDATNKNVTWSSSNPSVATVSNGVVKAVSAGSATISVTTADGGKSASCQVTVTAKSISVTNVSLDKASAQLVEGDQLTLTATVSPIDATNKNVTWSSSNPSVATVSNGVVIAVSAGSATISVTTADGAKSASCQVVVKSKTISVTGISLDKTSTEIFIGDSLTLVATVLPSNATNKNVTWSSSNTSVATVNNGIVKAVAVGNVTITATSVDGNKKAWCNVSVKTKTGVEIGDWGDGGNEGGTAS